MDPNLMDTVAGASINPFVTVDQRLAVASLSTRRYGVVKALHRFYQWQCNNQVMPDLIVRNRWALYAYTRLHPCPSHFGGVGWAGWLFRQRWMFVDCNWWSAIGFGKAEYHLVLLEEMEQIRGFLHKPNAPICMLPQLARGMASDRFWCMLLVFYYLQFFSFACG